VLLEVTSTFELEHILLLIPFNIIESSADEVVFFIPPAIILLLDILKEVAPYPTKLPVPPRTVLKQSVSQIVLNHPFNIDEVLEFVVLQIPFPIKEYELAKPAKFLSPFTITDFGPRALFWFPVPMNESNCDMENMSCFAFL
jgi:hypothetical protein